MPRSMTKRQDRAIRNDARIHDAALETLGHEGWAGLSLAAIARKVGMNESSVATRYEDRAALAADVWRVHLADRIQDRFEAVLVPLDGPSVDRAALTTGLRPFFAPDLEMSAACELMVVSAYDDAVRNAIRSTLGAQLQEWLTPVRRRVTRVRAAGRAVLLMQAMGLALERRRRTTAPPRIDRHIENMARALDHPATPRSLPTLGQVHWDLPPRFDTGSESIDALLSATLREISIRGYEASTTERIARSAGASKGLLFGNYESKNALFIDATQRSAAINSAANEDLIARLRSKYSVGVSEAILWREEMRPGREGVRTIALEQYRLTWHDPQMLAATEQAFRTVVKQRAAESPDRTSEQFEAELFTDMALGIGVLLLPVLAPQTWALPFDTFTVPMLDGL